MSLIITGVLDGPLTGGVPKLVELFAVNNVADLSSYRVANFNNGDTNETGSVTLAGSATAGDYIYIISLTTSQADLDTWFGVGNLAITGSITGTGQVIQGPFGAVNTNGDDAFYLYGPGGGVIDEFGVVGLDGTGQPWEYLDGWAYRVDGTVAAGDNFNSNDWAFSGINALDGETVNGTAATPFPNGTFSTGGNGTILAIADVTQAEGNTGTTAFTFTITRTNDTSTTTTVEINTQDGTAIAGSDYTSITSQTVTFTPGETTQTVTVNVTGDTTVEADETFSVVVSNASGAAVIADGTATGTIQADDGVPITRIHAIQGTADQNLLDNQIVTIEAIVVGDFQDGDADNSRNLNGVYIQEEDQDVDGNVLTSEGIFMSGAGSADTTDVNVGDLVRITGTVDEFFGETQIDTVTDITVVSSGNTLPTAANITLPTVGTTTSQDGDAQPNLEAFEGMLVNVSDTLTITEMFQLDRFNEIKLSQGGRLEQFTQNNAPSVAGYNAHLTNIGARTIIYDDGLSEQNALIGNLDGFGPTFSTATDIRMGDTINNLSGVLSYQWAGNAASGATWRVRSTQNGENSFTKVNNRSATPDNVGGSLKAVSFNVLNYFTTLDTGSNTTANGSDPRGADNTAEFNRQTQKLVTALSTIDADILGLVELENDFLPGSAGNAIANLVSELNAVAGAGTYAWVNPGQQFVGDDAIAVGFIYKTRAVNPVGNAAILNTQAFLDPNNTGASRNRAALAQTFQQVSSGETLTAVVNHFKSKGNSGLSAGDPNNPDSDQGDGQGFWNDTRTKAAQALANWLDTDPTSSGDSDFLILGDLNAYAQENPITTLEAAGYTNLAAQFLGANLRSFVFDGQTGTLDYALASPSLLSQVTGTTEWHINADEPDAIDYNTDFGRNTAIFDGTVPYRSSDHDPLIIGVNLGTTVTPIDPINPGDPVEPPIILGVKIKDTQATDRLVGGAGNDILIGLGGADRLLGEDGDDFLVGGRQRDRSNDRLFGGDGDDIFIGGRGRDRYEGGAGNDTFIFKRSHLRDRPDILLDFEVGSDKIDLQQVFRGRRFNSDTPFEDYVRLRGSSRRTVVQIDRNGNRAGENFKSLVIFRGVDVDTVDADSFTV